jgi:hypothetical protein
MEQTYNGPVGQVAGGNIINEAPKTPQEKSDQELKKTIAKEKRIIRKARFKQIFNIANFTLLVVVTGMLAYLWYMISEEGLLSLSNQPQEAQTPWHLFVLPILILVPAYFSIRATKEQRLIIESSEAVLNECKVVLNRRKNG